MNAAPGSVLDAEFGFTRKLAPAGRRVLSKLKRQTEELQRIETFRRRNAA
jgi:hypothetical protein